MVASSADRRRFSRFVIPLAVRYQTLCPRSGEMLQGEGIITNISLSGSLFHTEHLAALETGQLIHLNIAAPLLFLENDHTSRLTVTGRVVRFEPPARADLNCGVAVSFVEDLSFAFA